MKELNFDLSKKIFEDGFEALYAKECLYRFIEVNELIEILKDNGISISVEEILKDYKKCFNMDSLVQKYTKKFEKELKKLDDKFILLDSDCIYFLIDITIKENFDVRTLPDPGYIMEYATEINKMEDEDKASNFLQLLKSINKIKEYDSTKDLEKIFDRYCNIEDDIADCSCMCISKKCINRRLADNIGKQLEELTDYYKLIDQQFPYSLAMEFKGLYGFENIKELLEKCINKYPKRKIRFYFDAITSIPEKDKMRQKLIDEILTFKVVSEEDKMYMEDLKEWI